MKLLFWPGEYGRMPKSAELTQNTGSYKTSSLISISL